MPKVTSGATAAVLIAFAIALTGCSATEPGPVSAEETSAPPVSAQARTAEEVPAALSEQDEQFLAYVDQETPDFTATALPDMTVEEKLAAGADACEQIAAGVPMVELRLVPGETPSATGDYLDSSAIFNGALVAYCPELMVQPAG